MITFKRLAQFIGQKNLFKKILGGCNKPPSEDEGKY